MFSIGHCTQTLQLSKISLLHPSVTLINMKSVESIETSTESNPLPSDQLTVTGSSPPDKLLFMVITSPN